MLKLKDPEKHGWIGAVLDEDGNAVKVTCDAFEVQSMWLDGDTEPMGSAIVVYRRVNSETLETGGPLTQHIITGTDLTDMLEATGGAITIEGVEDSTLITGIPGSHILPEDFDGKIESDTMGRFISNTKKQDAKLKAQARKPATVPPPKPGPPGGPPTEPPEGPPPEVEHHRDAE